MGDTAAEDGRPVRVWITGASEGIGRAVAEQFAAQGAALALCARRPGPLQEAAERLKALGASQVVTTTGDMGIREHLERFTADAMEGLGGCDVLIHNAGGGGPGGIFELDDEAFEDDWHYAFEVNLMAPARLARAAADALRASRGVIIHVSSAWSRQPMEITPPSYGTTKAGLNHLTMSLARDLGGDGVRVVGVAPGPVWTESWERDLHAEAREEGRDPEDLRGDVRDRTGADTSLNRPGEMVELARAIAWLASSEASFITGTTVAVDGGYVRAI
ncbi:MAG: SDR family oxidoreductase [Myxococcota bacterium]|nr:SDR family oxidoreductase [Myxococcota bacterium]